MFFMRYLAALFYDAMILSVLFFTVTALMLPFNHHHAIAPGTLWYQCTLMFTAFIYYQSSMRFGGQTLGMRAWRFKLTTLTKETLSNKQIVLRILCFLPSFFMAIFYFKASYMLLNQWTRSDFIKTEAD
ncbi:RDD family protein [uncultured Legionella sp.]|uniref:RDD family protein n=1 Tax=uncultured Legionella sp. TaxID=210934 RepID=UPI0026331703|nr:RDD family protein [uncultured Legionella sp.]